MNWRIELYSTEMLNVMRKSTWTLVGIVGVATLWLVGEGFLMRSAISEKKNEVKQKQQTLAESRRMISEASAISTDEVPRGFKAIASFQESTEHLATKNGCEIIEYRASKDLLPFVPSLT